MQLLKTNGKNMVGASRFERPTSCSQGRRANQAALRPAIQIPMTKIQAPNDDQ